MKRLIAISVVLLFCLSGCLTMRIRHIIASGTIEQMVNFNGKTYVKFEGDDQTYACEYAPWFNEGNFVQVIKTKEGCRFE